MAGELTPADLIVRLVKAAEEVTRDAAHATDPPLLNALRHAVDALGDALAEEAREVGEAGEAGHWEPCDWGHVAPGDRVRLNGAHESRVLAAIPLRWVQRGRKEVKVTLAHRPGAPYAMPPSGPVEVWRASLPDWAVVAAASLGADLLT